MISQSKNRLGQMLLVGGFLCAVAHTSLAESNKEKVEKAVKGMCDKFQSCTLEIMQADGEGMPKSMLDMFLQQAQMQCQQIMPQEKFDESDEEMVEKGMTCLNDMAEASCESLMSGMQPESCIEFKQYESQR